MNNHNINKKDQDEEHGDDWFGGRPLSGNYQTRTDVIIIKRLKDRILMIIDLSMSIFFALGLSLFALWIYQEGQIFISHPEKLLTFFLIQHPFLLIFSLSLVAGLFIIYRRSEKKAAKQKIKYKDWFYKDILHEDLLSPYFGTKRKELDVVSSFSDECLVFLDKAYLLAKKYKQSEVRPIHLFKVFLKDKKVQTIFVRLNINVKELLEKVNRYAADQEENSKKTIFSQGLKEAFTAAFQNAALGHRQSVEALDILAILPEKDFLLSEILYELEVTKDKLENTVSWFQINDKLIEKYNRFHNLARFKPDSGMNRSYTAIATPTLNNFSHDLTLAAKYGYLEICVARDEEFSQIFENIGSGRNGILLVGDIGVGKKTMLEGLAQLMVEEGVPEFLKDKRLVELDVSRLLSGASASDAEERLLACIQEANSSGNIILAIQNVEDIVGVSSGQESSLDLSEVLSQSLARNHVICLATATSDNYRKYLEGKALDSTLAKIKIQEPDENKAILILESKVAFLEQKYKVYFLYEAIEGAVRLSAKYLHEKYLPLKALELLQDAVVISAKKAQRGISSFCSLEDVSQAISAITGIPSSKIGENEGERLLNLESEIHKRLIGQEEAVSMVSNSLRRARLELKDNNRPMASFLLLGPTGVGKTELAKVVSEVYFGGEEFMIRLDMSEYQYQDSVKKMIGDENGVIGYLTSAVRKKPFSLILFDEVEKAHPDVLNLFLQLMDDGRLTDGQGRTVNFKYSIIIATSNIGALYIQESLNKQVSIDEIRENLINNELNQYMRPELVNRFDGIVVFKPLSENNLFNISKLLFGKIKTQLEKKGIGFSVDKSGALKLAKDGYDPKFGARPLRRLLQERIEDKVAALILAGHLRRRDTVVIGKDGELTVKKGKEL